MPLLVTFRDWPVIKKTRIEGGYLLTLTTTGGSAPPPRLVITHVEWATYGRAVMVSRKEMPDLRKLAAFVANGHEVRCQCSATNLLASELDAGSGNLPQNTLELDI